MMNFSEFFYFQFSTFNFQFFFLSLQAQKEPLRTIALRGVKRESGVNPGQFQLL